jgi:hypothetical protein
VTRGRFDHITTTVPPELAQQIREAVAAGEYLLSEHATEQMIHRNVSVSDLVAVVTTGTPIEYDNGEGEHVPGVLFNGLTSGGRPLHVKMSERRRGRYLTWVVTVYIPEERYFEQNFSVRISTKTNTKTGKKGSRS